MTDREPVRILASTSGVERIRRDLDRRRFLGLAAAVGAGAALAACSPGGGSTSTATAGASGGKLEDKLSIFTWGEYDAPTVLDAFTKEKGPKVELSSYGSNEEMISKLVAAKGTSGYDIVVPTGTFIPQMIENELLTKLNRDLIPNISAVDPAYLARDWDPENEYSICKAWGTTGFVYDTDVIQRDLTTWSDFIDAAKNEASGNTTLLDDPAEISGLYFWSEGIDWNTTDTDDLAALEKFTLDLAPHIKSFESYPGSNVIPQGSAALMQAWNGDARLGLQETKKNLQVGPRSPHHRVVDGQLGDRRRSAPPGGRARVHQLHPRAGAGAQAVGVHRLQRRWQGHRGQGEGGRRRDARHDLLHRGAGRDDEDRRAQRQSGQAGCHLDRHEGRRGCVGPASCWRSPPGCG